MVDVVVAILLGEILTSIFVVIITLHPYDSSKDNKIRPLGFVCDICKGKYDKSGNLLLRCRLKPKVLLVFGIRGKKPETTLVEPEKVWLLDDL